MDKPWYNYFIPSYSLDLTQYEICRAKTCYFWHGWYMYNLEATCVVTSWLLLWMTIPVYFESYDFSVKDADFPLMDGWMDG